MVVSKDHRKTASGKHRAHMNRLVLDRQTYSMPKIKNPKEEQFWSLQNLNVQYFLKENADVVHYISRADAFCQNLDEWQKYVGLIIQIIKWQPIGGNKSKWRRPIVFANKVSCKLRFTDPRRKTKMSLGMYMKSEDYPQQTDGLFREYFRSPGMCTRDTHTFCYLCT